MTPRETSILVFEVAFATALAFAVGEILRRTAGLSMTFALPAGELVWAAIVLYFVS
jgi:hypothetical protein